MNGLELSHAYYEAAGRPLLERDFADLLPYLAIGQCGSGSENFGFDDEVSRDHDFEPGFLIFLPGEDVVDRRAAFLLERAYAKLPREFEGVFRQKLQPVGGPRHGVVRTAEFFSARVGTPDGALTTDQWLALPEQALCEATNGTIFADAYGEVTRIRQALAYYPDDVRLKKLAGQLLLMGQSGQYNYRRCLSHGETGAAQLAAAEFVRSTMATVFLLNRRYQPYYKWSFRAMRMLPKLALLAELLEYLLTTDNEPPQAEEKADAMEGIAADIIDELAAQGLTDAVCGDLEKHAYSVNDHVADPTLRNRHVLAAV